jgi:DNA-binding MarR family transcriptional regulator
MSISDARRRGAARPRQVRAFRPREGPAGARGLPPTTTRRPLLERGSDRRFRALVYDLMTVATRMNGVREHLARRMQVTGPQYSVLMAIAQFQDKGGVGVGALARLLHVSSAFVATETGKLGQAGLAEKRPNPKDRRRVILRLTTAGMALIEANAAEIRAINDEFFGQLDQRAFAAVSAAIGLIEAGSRKAIERIEMLKLESAAALREAAE